MAEDKKNDRKARERETIARWNRVAHKLLVGQTIKSVSYMTDDELKDSGWDRRTVMIEFNSGFTIYASADDEGNNAGAIFTTDKEVPVLPVI